MDEPIVVGLDVGTSKIVTLVARIENGTTMRVLGVGVEPSHGIRNGNVVDINAASDAIARSIEKAERTSGYEINSAIVSLAGAQVSSTNSKGIVGISGRVIDQEDVFRALDSAQAIAIPHNREIIHVIQRGFIIDGQEGIRQPVGMHGYRLEVETHIITASSSTINNLRQCVSQAGIDVSDFVLNPPWQLVKPYSPKPNAIWASPWSIWAGAPPILPFTSMVTFGMPTSCKSAVITLVQTLPRACACPPWMLPKKSKKTTRSRRAGRYRRKRKL